MYDGGLTEVAPGPPSLIKARYPPSSLLRSARSTGESHTDQPRDAQDFLGCATLVEPGRVERRPGREQAEARPAAMIFRPAPGRLT